MTERTRGISIGVAITVYAFGLIAYLLVAASICMVWTAPSAACSAYVAFAQAAIWPLKLIIWIVG